MGRDFGCRYTLKKSRLTGDHRLNHRLNQITLKDCQKSRRETVPSNLSLKWGASNRDQQGAAHEEIPREHGMKAWKTKKQNVSRRRDPSAVGRAAERFNKKREVPVH